MRHRIARAVDASSVLTQVLSTVHDLTGASDVTADTPLMEAGVDSLAATELANRLRSALGEGVSLSPTLVFEQPTPRAIAAHAVEQLVGAQPEAIAPTAQQQHLPDSQHVAMLNAAGSWPGGSSSAAVLCGMLH